MRTPQEAEADARRRGPGCLTRVLAAIGALTVLAVVAATIAVLAFTRPWSGGSGATPTPGVTGTAASSPAAPTSAADAPPADLPEGHAWMPTLDLTTSRVFSGARDLRNVHVVGSGVRLAPDSSMTASTLDVDADVPFSVIEAEAGRGVRLSPGGTADTVAVALPVTVLGRTVNLAGIARVTPDGERIAIDPESVTGAGLLDGALGHLPAIRRPVSGLPGGMRVSQISVTDTGFRVHATGNDVTVTP